MYMFILAFISRYSGFSCQLYKDIHEVHVYTYTCNACYLYYNYVYIVYVIYIEELKKNLLLLIH